MFINAEKNKIIQIRRMENEATEAPEAGCGKKKSRFARKGLLNTGTIITMETVTNSSGDDGPLEGFPLGLLLQMRPLRLSAAQRLPEVTQQGEAGPRPEPGKHFLPRSFRKHSMVTMCPGPLWHLKSRTETVPGLTEFRVWGADRS